MSETCWAIGRNVHIRPRSQKELPNLSTLLESKLPPPPLGHSLQIPQDTIPLTLEIPQLNVLAALPTQLRV